MKLFDKIVFYISISFYSSCHSLFHLFMISLIWKETKNHLDITM